MSPDEIIRQRQIWEATNGPQKVIRDIRLIVIGLAVGLAGEVLLAIV